MINELLHELRSYPAHYTAAHRAADALEKREYYNCRLEDDLVSADLETERLRKHIAKQQLDIVTLGQEVGRLREAMKPFAWLYLWPDDLGNASAGIKAEEDWCVDKNDAKADDQWVKRGDIRRARAALGEEKK